MVRPSALATDIFSNGFDPQLGEPSFSPALHQIIKTLRSLFRRQRRRTTGWYLASSCARFQRRSTLPANLPTSRRSAVINSAQEIWNATARILEVELAQERCYLPRRSKGEKLQVWQLMNFKGGLVQKYKQRPPRHIFALARISRLGHGS